jgi:hypothetical protein
VIHKQLTHFTFIIICGKPGFWDFFKGLDERYPKPIVSQGPSSLNRDV